MKVKTINKVIKNKLDEFLKSIKNKKLREEVKESIILTGGAIANLFLTEPVNDFDLYFNNSKTLTKLVQYYIKEFKINKLQIEETASRVFCIIKSDGAINLGPYEETNVYKPVFITDNSITLTDQIQLITRFVGSPEEIHKNFDFVHATNYWTYKDKLVTNQNALETLLTKELRYKGSLFPLCSLIRIRKFVKRGFTINAGQILKMCLQVSKLNLDDHLVLREQLIGVDSAYFSAFLEILDQNKNNGRTLSPSHVLNLIDYIFDEKV